MGYETYTTGTVRITPSLNVRERSYLRRIGQAAPKSRRMPGYALPWHPSDDGATLSIPMEYGTKEPVAEWLSYLNTDLLGGSAGRRGTRLSGFTYDHQMAGDVEFQGRSSSDRWTLVANDAGLWVHRPSLPCPSCWAGVLTTARPSNAHRFVHPDPAANMVEGRMPRFDHDALEEDCLAASFTPVGHTWRAVTWPWPGMYSERWWLDHRDDPTPRLDSPAPVGTGREARGKAA